MSPPRPKSAPEGVSRTQEWKIAGKAAGLGLSGRRSATVKVEGERVRVTWFEGTACASRLLTVHGLKELIMLVDGTGHRYHDMWLDLKESNGGRKFYLRVAEDGSLTANERPVDHGFVPWPALKHAFEQALEELDSGEDD